MASLNSLSQLISQYNSDDDEDENSEHEKSSTATFPNTDWTKCFAKDSGHPYYWNTVTREVTWEMPNEYAQYLESIRARGLMHMENDPKYWSESTSADNDDVYYVNKISRVVSWDKPAGFQKSTIASATAADHTSKPETKKKRVDKNGQTKRKNPFAEPIMDEKIELISHYVEKSESSSDDEEQVPRAGMIKHMYGPTIFSDTLGKSKKKAQNILVPQYNAAAEEDDVDDPAQKIDTAPLFPSAVRPRAKQNARFKPPISQTPLLGSHRIYSIKTDSIVDTPPPPLCGPIKILQPETVLTEILSPKTEELDESITKDEDVEIIPEDGDKVEVEQPKTLLNYNEGDFNAKTFKRRRRIEFQKPQKVVAPPSVSSSKINETESNGTKTIVGGYGNFIKSSDECVAETDRDLTSVVEGENASDEKIELEKNCEQKFSEEIKESGLLIKDKLKFLTDSITPATSAQIMAIQLDTLMAAYESKSLNEEYLLKWIRDTDATLEGLEKEAVPEGWICEWDRQNAQYFYKHVTSGKIQWEFPMSEEDELEKELKEIEMKMHEEKEQRDTESVQVATETKVKEIVPVQDEMDISTTPPPPIECEVNEIDLRVIEPPGIIEQTPEKLDEDRVPSPPPPPIISKSALGLELESFYSDLASMENEIPPNIPTTTTTVVVPELKSTKPANKRDAKASGLSACTASEVVKTKKKKKTKVTTLNAKLNDISGMVAKWQKVQKDLDS